MPSMTQRCKAIMSLNTSVLIALLPNALDASTWVDGKSLTQDELEILREVILTELESRKQQ